MYENLERNCQTFALRQLSSAVLCPTCPQGPNSPKRGPTNAFYSLYAIPGLREHILYAGGGACVISVIRRVYGLPITSHSSEGFLVLLLIPALSVVLSFIPTSRSRTAILGPQAYKYLGTTLFDWELQNLPPLEEQAPVWTPRLTNEADCLECAEVAAVRFHRTRKCLDSQRPRGTTRHYWCTRLLWLKVLLTFPLWAGPFYSALLISSVSHYSWFWGIFTVVYMVLLMVMIANHPSGDLCRAGYGFNVLYHRSVLRELIGWAVLIHVQGRQFWLHGVSPTRENLGFWRLTATLIILGWFSRRALSFVALKYCFGIFLEFLEHFRGSWFYIVFHLSLAEFKDSYWIVLEEMTALLILLSVGASFFWRRSAVFLP